MTVTDSQVHDPTSHPHYDPFEFYDDPYPVYRLLRDAAPLYYNEALDLWVLSRFDDIQAVARDWETFSSGQGVALDDESELYAPGAFLDYDPPAHDRLRAAMASYFSPKSIHDLESSVRIKARALLDPFLESGEIDIAAQVARPLPASVVCTLLGFPESDHSQLLDWFAQMINKEPGQDGFSPTVWEANKAMRAYINDTADDRARTPQADLLSVLVAAEGDKAISRDELVGMTIFVFYAGIMTTAGFISNSFNNLTVFDDQRNLIASDPGLIPAAVEELLRYDSPVQSVSRVTTRDIELHSTAVPKGSRVLILYGSANRDERRWEDPDSVSILRRRRRHLAFGEGIHHCLGAPLARLEGKVVLEEAMAVLPNYEIAGEIERLYAPHERSIEKLPIRFAPVKR